MRPVLSRIEDIVDDHVRIQYRTALRIRKILKQDVPNDQFMWEEWFQEVWGISFQEYATKAREENIKQRVMEYEIKIYGYSSLANDD